MQSANDWFFEVRRMRRPMRKIVDISFVNHYPGGLIVALLEVGAGEAVAVFQGGDAWLSEHANPVSRYTRTLRGSLVRVRALQDRPPDRVTAWKCTATACRSVNRTCLHVEVVRFIRRFVGRPDRFSHWDVRDPAPRGAAASP